MGQIKVTRWVALGAMATIFLLGASATAPASTAGPSCANNAPCNDNYIDSLELNQPGSRLNRTRTLQDERDTSTATVQSNILNPCGQMSCPNGPPEITNCNGVNYGKTIWYDFYPDIDGTVSIRASALFQNVITLYTFNGNPRAATYLFPTRVKCAVSSFGAGQLIAPVKKGLSYTFQIGGATSAENPTGAGGDLIMDFDFFPTPPHRLSANSTLTARATSSGIQLLSLSVSTARAARVTVSCGRYCRSESKSDQATESFPGLAGASMPAGSKLTIHVTAQHSIGVLIEYNIERGNFSKQTFCTEPGSDKPRSTCH